MYNTEDVCGCERDVGNNREEKRAAKKLELERQSVELTEGREGDRLLFDPACTVNRVLECIRTQQ